jgi:hypothetical protein
MKETVTALALVCVLAAAGPAAAAKPAYKGKTKEGTKISVWIEPSNKKYVAITTRVPTTCVSAQGGTPLALITDFDPPFAFRVGRTDRATVKGSGGSPTKHYTVRTRRRGKTLSGKLSVNYSRLSVSDFGGFYILTCQGTASFKLKRRAR